MARVKSVIICIFLILILAGCQTTPEEKIYHILEQTVAKEKEFDEQQKPLMDLEASEKELFDKIIDLGMKEMDKVTELSNSALKNLEQRREKMMIEQDSILSSKKEFSKIEDTIKEIKTEKIKIEAEQLYQLMEKRYDTHDRLYKAYIRGIDENVKLYQLLKKDELPIEDLENQIDVTNKAYSEVLKMNKLFNECTKEFNDSKLKFYKDANIKID
ncbi:YkyA family protein [Heyndrickxia sp. NPDC080065]|uniref:YkyA family protein n=1 Tax=Heyndrickxia sp. NPDC080065 TaxID=3390568 RepID=UPI003CFFBE4D